MSIISLAGPVSRSIRTTVRATGTVGRLGSSVLSSTAAGTVKSALRNAPRTGKVITTGNISHMGERIIQETVKISKHQLTEEQKDILFKTMVDLGSEAARVGIDNMRITAEQPEYNQGGQEVNEAYRMGYEDGLTMGSESFAGSHHEENFEENLAKALDGLSQDELIALLVSTLKGKAM